MKRLIWSASLAVAMFAAVPAFADDDSQKQCHESCETMCRPACHEVCSTDCRLVNGEQVCSESCTTICPEVCNVVCHNVCG